MRLSNSLRFRVALAFAVFGALLSMLLSAGIYLAQHEMGRRLMDETLRAELDDSVERYSRNPLFIPPNTVSIKGYVLAGTELDQEVPAEIRSLAPGKYDVIIIDGIDYRVLVADRNGVRYFMLFDVDSQNLREAKFLRFLSLFVLCMTLVSAGAGFWLALRIITPLTRLAEQVTQADPGDTKLLLFRMERDDEVGELAAAFDRYLIRIRKFVERENYFTTDVSHELRTPLAIIQGTVEVLEQDENLSAKQRERVARIKRASLDMGDLTSALLMLVREHRPSLHEAACDVGEVLRACVDRHQHLIADRPIRLDVELVNEVHLEVERNLLEIVIGNLLRNAFFNTQSGSVLLRLEADRLIVKDTGFGMSAEVLEHIFERHYKGPSSAGAGVGLTLVKRICDRYGWRIAIESQQGAGTTAEIVFTTS
jgi:signal transduction histidine kinase